MMKRFHSSLRASKSRSKSSSRKNKTARRLEPQVLVMEPLEPRQLLSVPTSWTNTGIGGTGTTYYPTFNPYTSTPGTELWVGSDMGETFHTTTFTDYADSPTLKLGHVGQVTWDTPANSGLINLLPEYGHTASTMYGWASSTLYKSTDSGVNWSTTGVTTPGGGIVERSQLFVDRTDANDRMVTLGSDHKAYISTNAGSTWTVINGGSTVSWISGVTYNGPDIYIGVNDYLNSGSPGSDSTRGLLKGTYSGGNWTWSWVTRSGLAAGEAFTSVVGLKDGATLRFMAYARQKDVIGFSQGDIFANSAAAWKVYSWSVGDGSWVDQSGTLPTTNNGVYVRGGQTTGGTPTFYIAGSTKGGPANVFKGTWNGTFSGWTDVFDESLNTGNVALSYQTLHDIRAYPSMFNLDVCPNNPDYVVWTNDASVYGSTTGGAHWAAISCDRAYRNPEGVEGQPGQPYVSTLNETSVWDVNFVDQNNIVANNTDANMTHSTNGGASWAGPKWITPYDDYHYNTTYDSAVAYDGTMLISVSGTHDCPADPQFTSDGYMNYSGYNAILGSQDKGVTFTTVLDQKYDFVNRVMGFASKMNGGIFQGANAADFSDAVNLYTIGTDVSYSGNGWNGTATSASNTAFRYFRYLAPAGSWGEVGQIEFYDAGGNPFSLKSGATVIGGGGVFGGTDSQANADYGYQRAFDPDVKNMPNPQFQGYHKGAQADGCWVGLDMGAGNAVAASTIKFQAPGMEPMMKSMVFGPQGTAYADRLYVVVNGTDSQHSGVWYSDNWRTAMLTGSAASVNWTHLSNGLTGTGSNGNLSPNGAAEELRALSDGTLMLVYHERSAAGTTLQGAGIWVLPAGQTTWVDRTAWYENAGSYHNVDPNSPGINNNWNMRYQVTDVIVDPTDPTENTWWLACPSTEWYSYGGGLYKTTDRGLHWTKPFNPPQQNYAGVWSVAINPANGEMFITANNGYSTQSDGNGLYYSPSSANPSFTKVTAFPQLANPLLSVRFNPFKANDLWVTTFGASMFRGDTTTVTAGLPAAPSALAVTTATGTSYTLQWTDNATTETGFKVEYAPINDLNSAGQPKWTTLETLGANSGTGTMTRTETIATGDKRYYFRVTATNANGSAYSNLIDAAIPTAPTLVSTTPESSSSVVLNWTDNSISETGFKIEYFNGSSWVAAGTADKNATSGDAYGYFAAGTAYTFRVSSMFTNEGGTSFSNASGSTSGSTLPGASTIACETFNYNTSVYPGFANGGFGWSSTWKSALGSKPSIGAGSLSYTNGSALSSAGNKANVPINNWISRDLTTPLSGVVWVGAAFFNAGGASTSINFNDKTTSTGTLQIGGLWYNNWMISVAGSGKYTDQGPVITSGVTHFVAIKLDLTNPNNITVSLYVDPTPGTQPASPTLSLSGIFQSELGSLSQLALLNGTSWDEIRFGSSYNDVAPNGTGVSVPTVTVSQQDASASETGPDVGVFRINRTGSTAAALVVNYTMGGQATNGTDYTTLSGTATIPIGASYVDVTLTPSDDAAVEGSETAILTVSPSANYTIGSPSNGTVTIADNDASTGLLYVSDDFNYSTGAINDSSQNGGTGLSGAWADNGVGYTFDMVSGNLSYSTLSTLGNKLHMKAWGGVVSRDTTTTFGADGQVVWVSYIMNIGNGGSSYPYAGMTIGNISLGSPDWHNGYQAIVGGVIGGVGTLARGTDTLVVAKITYGATDHVDMWINPTLGAEPTIGSGTYVGVNGSVGNTSTIGFTAADSSMDDYFDRLRIGDSWAAVTTGGGGATPTISVAAQDANAAESGPDSGVYRISRTGATTSPLTVYYSMSGAAVNGTDYGVLSGTATIGSGMSYVDVTLTPINDALVEGSEAAVLTLTSNAAYTIGSPSNNTVTIADSLNVTEDFNYTGAINGKGSTGNGWTGSWTGGGGASLATGSLAFSKNGYSLTTTNNKAELIHMDTASRNLTTTISGTKWYSFLFQQNATGSALKLSDQAGGTSYLSMGDPWSYGRFVWLAGSDYGTSNATITAGQTYFVVVKVTVGAPNDHVTVYVNPTPGQSAPEETADVKIFDFDTLATNVGNLNKVTIFGNGDYNNGVTDFDELRVGDSYAAVSQGGFTPTVTITNVATDSDASETGPDVGKFRITRDGSTANSLAVYYAMSGQATNGSDYTTLSGTATIAAGSAYVDVTLTPIDDSTVEGTETAVLTVTPNAAYEINGTGSDTVYIADNDLPAITVAAQDATASEYGPDAGIFRISRTGPANNALVVNYAMSGQATNGSDYSTLTGTATIPAGSSYVDVTLTPISDTLAETSETAVLTVSANATYTVGTPSNSTVNIANSLYAMEDFNYTGAMNGKGTTGNGWTSSWAGGGGANLASGSLAFAKNGYQLITSNNKAELTQLAAPTRNLAENLSGTKWYSFMFQQNSVGSCLKLSDQAGGSSYLSMGDPWAYGRFVWLAGSDYNATGPTITANQTYFVVVKVTFGAPNDHVSVYVNPTPGQAAPEETSDVKIFDFDTAATNIGTLNKVTFYAPSDYNAGISDFDEIRVGDSFAAVAPGVAVSTNAYWRLDEGTGTSAADSATGGATADTGTLNNTPTWVTGNVGKALQFNGTNQYVQVANSNDINITTNTFSVAMWAKSGATNWNSTQSFVSKGNAYQFGGVSGGKNIQFSLYIGGAWRTLTYTNAGDISTNWHHYAATYDGANMRIWVDGVNVATQAQTGNLTSDTNVLYIGRIGSSYLNGSVDEVRIYNTCLSSTVITALYNQANLSVTGLAVSGTHSASYSVQSLNLATGISQYGDVTKNFTTVPTKYLGSTWIKTAQADNNVTGVQNFLTFTVNTPVTVYVMYDDSIASKPTWLTSQFVDTGDNVVTQQGTFSVYSRTVLAGTFTLGSNLDSGTTTGGMYNVLLVPVV